MSDIEKNRIAEIRALLHELKELFEPPKLTTDMADVWHKVLRLGELLVKQKASLKHGEFGEWVRANLSMTEQMALSWMDLYRNREQYETRGIIYKEMLD